MAIPHLHIDRQHRLRSLALMTICCLGLAVSLIAGAREHEQMRLADQQQQAIAAGITKIAGALSTQTAAPDRILASAAARLVQQDQDLASLRQQINGLQHAPPNPDVLYKGDVPVAVVNSPVIDQGSRRIVFRVVTAHAELDMTTPFWFRTWSIKCVAKLQTGMINGAFENLKYWDLPCEIGQ